MMNNIDTLKYKKGIIKIDFNPNSIGVKYSFIVLGGGDFYHVSAYISLLVRGWRVVLWSKDGRATLESQVRVPPGERVAVPG